MKYLSFLIIFALCTSCLVQKKTEKINKLIDAIASHGGYMTATIGRNEVPTGQWANFAQLRKLINEKKLIALTDHNSPAVRCYAFQALSERKSSATFRVLLRHLKDNATIRCFEGCTLGNKLVGQFFLENTSYVYYSKDQYAPSIIERNTLDSLLLFDPQISSKLKRFLPKVIQPHEQYYPTLQQLYQKKKNLWYLLALSRYQKKEDQASVLEQFNKKENIFDYEILLEIIKNYPAPAFFPYLKKILEQEIKGEGYIRDFSIFYLALVQYQNLESKQLLAYALKNIPEDDLEDHQGYVWLALTKYPHPIYQDIKKSLKIDKWTKRELLKEFAEAFPTENK